MSLPDHPGDGIYLFLVSGSLHLSNDHSRLCHGGSSKYKNSIDNQNRGNVQLRPHVTNELKVFN